MMKDNAAVYDYHEQQGRRWYQNIQVYLIIIIVIIIIITL